MGAGSTWEQRQKKLVSLPRSAFNGPCLQSTAANSTHPPRRPETRSASRQTLWPTIRRLASSSEIVSQRVLATCHLPWSPRFSRTRSGICPRPDHADGRRKPDGSKVVSCPFEEFTASTAVRCRSLPLSTGTDAARHRPRRHGLPTAPNRSQQGTTALNRTHQQRAGPPDEYPPLSPAVDPAWPGWDRRDRALAKAKLRRTPESAVADAHPSRAPGEATAVQPRPSIRISHVLIAAPKGFAARCHRSGVSVEIPSATSTLPADGWLCQDPSMMKRKDSTASAR